MRWMGVSNSRATGERKVPLHLKNQEAPFLIEAMTMPAPAMKMIVPRTGEIGILSLVSATASTGPMSRTFSFLVKVTYGTTRVSSPIQMRMIPRIRMIVFFLQ